MKIDEKALEAACQEFKEHLYIAGKTSDDERVAIKAAIEAYEAARWRPIAEARKDVPVLVCLVDTRGEIYIATRDDDWRFDTYDDELTMTHQDLVDRGVLFMELPAPPKP